MLRGKQLHWLAFVPEITIKFNQSPYLPETGKKVTLNLTADNGIKLRATLNRKTLKKQRQKIEGCLEWVGILSGKIAAIDAEGVIEIDGANIIMFSTQKSPSDSDGTEIAATEATLDPLAS